MMQYILNEQRTVAARRFSRCGLGASTYDIRADGERRGSKNVPQICRQTEHIFCGHTQRGGQRFQKSRERHLWEPPVARLLRGNLCVQWIKTDKLELGREAACDLALDSSSSADGATTTTMCGWLNGGFFYFLLSHIIYHCSLSSLRRAGKSVKLEGEEGVT